MNNQISSLENTLNIMSGIIWGPITLILLLVVGIYLTFGLKGFSFFNLGYGFKSLFKKSKTEDDGEISSFDSLMTALSATVGTGNIA
ncbi:MAG: sodium:alanine symporter family protein, partial [Gammaproteobacteria bacterium]|nr:sodium:alanine symporter family protein [Gammaproteobacteria bacterium]